MLILFIKYLCHDMSKIKLVSLFTNVVDITYQYITVHQYR